MCGIAGWVDLGAHLEDRRPALEAMVRTLRNRGPDAEGVWVRGHAAIGHRRLAVVDPEGGAQPMVGYRGAGACVLTYNGELYNTEELRRALLSRGYRFQGHSDTEVLLWSYIEWGPACVERLNGIFAFAVWDDDRQRLFLARDRLGVKPLFYAAHGRELVFGSEPKALLAHGSLRPEVDAEGLAEVFALGPARTPGHGVFRGLQELRPGYTLTFDHAGVHHRRYWALASHPHPDDADTTAQVVRELLRDAVERQLVADVPVCAFLSGGVDSSALAGFAAAGLAQQGRGPLRTYSLDYADNDRYFRASDFQPDADGPYALRAATHLGTEHRCIVIDTQELVQALFDAVRAGDRPGMADIDASLYLFCRRVREEATVALSGESADEVFGGYPWLFRADRVNVDTFPWAPDPDARLRLLKPEVRAELGAAAYIEARYRQALFEVPRLEGEDARAARLRELCYLNLTRFMPTLLERKDRMSMAVGLEVRVPFCDHRLVEYVWNVPWELKTCGRVPKGILRRALADLLPPDIVWRPKSPFPKTHHPAYLEAVRRLALDIVTDPNSRVRPLVDCQWVQELARSGAPGHVPPWFGQLMSTAQLFAYLVQAEAWLREYRVTLV